VIVVSQDDQEIAKTFHFSTTFLCEI